MSCCGVRDDTAAAPTSGLAGELFDLVHQKFLRVLLKE